MADFEPREIMEGLWVGQAPSSLEDYQVLRDLGMDDAVSLQTEREARSVGLSPDVSFRLAMAYGLREHRVGIEDYSPSDLAATAWEAVVLVSDLRRRGRKVYLHCRAGVNRSPTVAAACVAWERGLEAGEACDLVIQAHPAALPDEKAVAAALRDLKRR